MADKDSNKDGGTNVPMESPIPSPIPTYTDEEKELAQAIKADFDAASYGACVDKLKKLAKMRPMDAKVQHNLAVATFYQSDCKQVEEIKRGLNQVCGKSQVSLGGTDALEDADHAILFYNHAVILYHLKQHRETIRILEKLFQVIEPLEDCLAHKVLFLLIDTYLCTYQPEKALGALNYLEKKLFGSDNKSQSGDKHSENSSSSSKESKDSSGADDGNGNQAHEKHRPRITQYKTRCFLQLKQMKVCKREIKSVVNCMGASSTALFLKSNFEFLRQNYRKAIKLLNSAPQTTDFRQTGESVPVLYFNNLACVHFYMHKFHLGAYYARRALQENANALAELPKKQSKAGQQSLSGQRLHTIGMNKRYELLYNTGIQLLHAGRPMAGFECLTEAVQVFPSNPRLWLRIAECCVMANKTTPSPESEGKGMPSSHKKGIVGNVVGTGPHRKIVLSPGAADNKYSSDGQSAAMPVATLEFASLCLCNALSLLPDDIVMATPHQVQAATRVSSRGSVSSDSSELSDVSGGKQPYPNAYPSPPGCALKAPEVSQLRCAILACSAYVSLTLGDNVTALEHAKLLLSQSKASGCYRFLGHLYAAEALINMDHIFDAIQHLSPDSVMDVSVLPPQEPGQGDRNDRLDSDNHQQANSQDGSNSSSSGGNADMQAKMNLQQHQYYPSSIQTAKATMLFNLASAHALRSEWDKARKCLHQACAMIPPADIPQQALFLSIYLELQTGNYTLALQMVKKQQLIPYIQGSGDAPPRQQPHFQHPQHVPPPQQQQPGFGTIGSGIPSAGFQHGGNGGMRNPWESSGSNKSMRPKSDPWHN